ncbi:hypothetical protein UFOVP41_14 [uncultured Caudovirales phage]|uniref:Uncharacterized protein n=1 Tax=uncultured Caudovirales phage TaxID=2100421 RepID=A0A6J5KSU8_9CAUD|nr:hypothetical protein UFOVP41_14 [uncultured Caudovirales phage]
MDLLDLVKMEDYLDRRGLGKQPAVKKPAPVIDKSEPYTPPNDMVKSSADDVGTQFRFNNNQNDNMA